jgi:tetratricopeptide (TPR) repeat protein
MFWKYWRFFLPMLVIVFLTNCAGMGDISSTSSEMAERYLAEGQTLENNGDWVGASRNYKLALTVDPQNTLAADGVQRAELGRQQSAEAHYQKGLELLKQGKYRDGRREFLASLRFWPQHQGALERLRTRTKIKADRYILHTVQEGETISTISKKYYDDIKHFQTIAKFNNLPDATTIQLGKELKIPKIEGVPFLVSAGTEEFKTEAMADQLSISDWEYQEAQQAEAAQLAAKAYDDQVASYRNAGLELYREEQYDEAVIEFRKVVNADPNDQKAQEYLYRAHYSSAQNLLREKQYQAADRQLQACLAFRSDCAECPSLIKKCEASYKELHYQLGIQYFGEEKPEAAIQEWQLVKKLDPNYKQVEQNIKKAQKIATKIQQLKKENKE